MLKRVLISLVCLAVLFALPISWSSQLRNTTVKAIRPVGNYLVDHNVALSNFFHNISQLSSLRDDKAALQNQVVALQIEVADKETVTRENEALRKEIGVTGTTKDHQKVLAHVVLVGSALLDRTFTIDVGTSSGVKVGQAAVNQGGLIGKIISTREDSAVVRSIISKESRIQAWLSDSREKGLLIGDGNSVYLSDITQGVNVPDQSIIETSGLGGSLPQGILVGQVDGARSKKSELSQSFSVKLAQDPFGIESLFILLTDTE